MQVFALTKEHLLVEELYHQQQLTVAALRSECTQLKEIKALNEALSKEKEGYIFYLSFSYSIYIYIYIDADYRLSVCKVEIKKLKQLLEENKTEMKKRDNQIVSLKSFLQTAQEKYVEKSNVSINNIAII